MTTMFSDEETKESGSGFMRSDDEIISIREVYFNNKRNRRDSHRCKEPSPSVSCENNDRSCFNDDFFPDKQEQAHFAWTEEDGNIASLVSSPGFGCSGSNFQRDLIAELKAEQKEADTSSSASRLSSSNENCGSGSSSGVKASDALVSSTSNGPGLSKNSQKPYKVDKADPRSRYHFVKFVKRQDKTIKLWECGICGREFQHQYTLMRHLPTHTDERNFHCDACGKSFRQLSTLSQHRAIHSAERPYACEVCSKTFNRVSTLISHRKTHSDDKPYKCHLCPKGFHQKGNLRNHLFTHTNERPYRCSICYKGFNQQSNLVCHKNKAHPEDSSTGGSGTLVLPNSPTAVRIADSSKKGSLTDNCEVTSSTVDYLTEPSSSWSEQIWSPRQSIDWSVDSGFGTGVILDPIQTYHMGVALATKQTPFALLKPDTGAPVLVKIVHTELPGGKQMLVPATAEDLKVGGKIVIDDDTNSKEDTNNADMQGAMQIRVPVVATVVPRVNAGGHLHLTVEEPHQAYHSTLSNALGGMNIESCIVKKEATDACSSPDVKELAAEPKPGTSSTMTSENSMSSASPILPPAPSPLLDLMPMDLFENMDCIAPMEPQITAVYHIDQPPQPPSSESDIFISEFEESIPLDSD